MVGQVAELIASMASLFWPILVFSALVMFRSDVRGVLSRLKRGKILGHEIELDPQVKKFHEIADEASTEADNLPRPTTNADETAGRRTARREAEDRIQELLGAASRSPRYALILLATELEREARDVLASIGDTSRGRPLGFRRVVERLDSHYGLPKQLLTGLRLFLEVRNRLVHGGSASERDIVSALDSGLLMLRLLESLPRERSWVEHAQVPVFLDRECLHELPDAKGVILRTESPDRGTSMYRIFPSRRTHFEPGKRVSWEWNVEKVWPQAWYRDPTTKETKEAWTSSAEFTGRHFRDL